MDSISNKLEYPTTVKSASVVDSVKDWIIDQIIKRNLKPGSKLPTEAELCANLGASRNSVREAIKQLEAHGVVYIKRADGTFVADSFDPKMLSPVLYSLILQNSCWQDFVELRRAIEIGTIYVLMGRGLSEEDVSRLEAATEALESAVRSNPSDIGTITEVDCRFHNLIISLTRNPQLLTLSEYINRITVPSREKTTELILNSGEIDAFVSLHRQMFNIIVQGDKSGIEKTVMDHYVFWEKLSD